VKVKSCEISGFRRDVDEILRSCAISRSV